MIDIRSAKDFGKLLWVSTAVACLIASSSPATAQPGGGGGGGGGLRGPRLAPEKQEAAWGLEAKSVSDALGLEKDSAAKLAGAYKAARKSYQDASQKLVEESAGDRMAVMQGFLALRAQESSKLEGALKLEASLKEDQVKSAMGSLGAFSGLWDQMADVLAGFKLPEDKLSAAMKLAKEHVEKVNAAQEESMASMDFQALRETTQELKGKLDTDIAPLLSAEQLAHWKEKTTAKRVRREGGRQRTTGGDSDSGEAKPAAPPAAK